jgi:hypothetical protein
MVMARYDGSEPSTKRRTYHYTVLNEEQQREQSVPQQHLEFRGIKAEYGNGSDDEKYSVKKE